MRMFAHVLFSCVYNLLLRVLLQAPDVLHQPLSEAKLKHLHAGPPAQRDDRGALIAPKKQAIVHNLCPGS
jgi:hypothetical protein